MLLLWTLQLHGDSLAGPMETCVRADSISERQLPWVNGGVILLESLLCPTPLTSAGENPSLPELSYKRMRLMASFTHSAPRKYCASVQYSFVQCFRSMQLDFREENCIYSTWTRPSSSPSAARSLALSCQTVSLHTVCMPLLLLPNYWFPRSILFCGCPYISLSSRHNSDLCLSWQEGHLCWKTSQTKSRSGGKVRAV